MSTSPYTELPESAFWKTAVAQGSPFNPIGIYKKKWDIDPNWRVATAGSCFAQHIGQQLTANGFNVLDLEPAPPGLPKALHQKYGFSTYSCRYGNIYTTTQLLQLAREAAGEFEGIDIAWEKNGRFYDALRPAVEPEGLDSPDEVWEQRKYHLARVREMFTTMDLFIFTLGLTESWIHKESGTVYPMAPGTIAGEFDDSKHALKNLSFPEVVAALRDFFVVLKKLRADKGLPKTILTVSPVPLTATASGKHVLQATTYSKSVLRATAGSFSNNPLIDYFPSYEIITSPSSHGSFYESNLRSVRPAGVETVMRSFFTEHPPVKADTSPPQGSDETTDSSSRTRSDIQCEEALLEAFAK
jgi:hypothetical protein